MTTKKKILIAVILVLVAGYAFWCWWTAPDPELQKDAEPPAKGQLYSVQSLQDETQRIVNEQFPGHNTVEYNADNQKLVVTLWADYFTADMVNAALFDLNYLNKWRSLEASMAELGAVLQSKYDDYGHEEVVTIVRLVDPGDHSRDFAIVSRGELVYDVVEATPTGETIPGT